MTSLFKMRRLPKTPQNPLLTGSPSSSMALPISSSKKEATTSLSYARCLGTTALSCQSGQNPLLMELRREEHSMDQCRSRLKLSENFERHWSIRISGEIHMDQSLVHTFSWGNSYFIFHENMKRRLLCKVIVVSFL